MPMRKVFDLVQADIENYDFIAHLLDRVLIGRVNEPSHDDLLEAFYQNRILEVHLFNTQKELFASLDQGVLVAYAPLEHRDGAGITRSYQLEEKWTKVYEALEVKEYINYDENHLAYVDKTVLYRLKRKGNANG